VQAELDKAFFLNCLADGSIDFGLYCAHLEAAL